MPSRSSSVSGRFLSSSSFCSVHACICSGVMLIKWPGVGVAMAIAFCPVGVVPDGVNPTGVIPPGVIPVGVILPGVIWLGVLPPGVMLGVMLGVMALGVAPGVSSHRERRLLAPGVGVSWIRSPAPRSVLGVSAQPAWAGVSVKLTRTMVK